MPSHHSNIVVTSSFELPALDLDFGSITDGTDIPPPPESPPRNLPEPSSSTLPQLIGSDVGGRHTSNLQPATPSNGKLVGTKRRADDASPSFAGLSRQSSLRRLFSRTTSNNNSTEHQLPASGRAIATSAGRPVSRSSTTITDEQKSKRGSGWFRRLRTGDHHQSKRRSILIGFDGIPPAESSIEVPKAPPPMIPEFIDLEKGEDGLGADLFKHIK